MSDSTNLMNGQEEKREEDIEKGGKSKLLGSVVRGLAYIVLSAIALVVIYVLIYLFHYSENKEVADILDFVISGLSAIVLVISFLDIFIKKRWKWIITLLFINAPSYLLMFVLLFWFKIDNIAKFSRIISLVCLIASLIILCITCMRYEKEATVVATQKTEDNDENKNSSDEK